MLAELKASLPDIKAMSQKATPQEIIGELLANTLALGLGGREVRSEEAWGTLFAPYIAALSEFPITLLRQAFIDWHAGKCYPDPKDFGRHAFYPKPAELCHLIKAKIEQIRLVQYRAEVALSGRYDPPPPPISPEERAKVAEMMAEFSKEIAGKKLPTFKPPTMTPSQAADRLRAMAAAQEGGREFLPI